MKKFIKRPAKPGGDAKGKRPYKQDERKDRPERPERSERPAREDRPERPRRFESRPERAGRDDRPERPRRFEPRPDRPERRERPARYDRFENDDRPPRRPRDDEAPRSEPWSKQGRHVWRSEKAQAVGPGASRGRRASSDDDQLLATISSKRGPAGYDKFSDIPAHKLGRTLRGKLYQLANTLPSSEEPNLGRRIKFLATTVTSSIATGFGEGTFKSCVNRSLESRGALFSLQDHIEQLMDEKMIPEDAFQNLKGEVDQVASALHEFMGQLAKDRDHRKEVEITSEPRHEPA